MSLRDSKTQKCMVSGLEILLPSLYPGGGGKFLDSEEKGLKDLPDIIWWSRIPGIPQREGIPELISHPAASGRKS
ncbi:hypothetical protein CDAR_472911 [Caerostris darwini]|uniref:Uncharacterized protein n=1 Tax=Caerostris darwini TaxID=1538125 RepID=A0AAV4V9E9_9ARAC|nr:hypothetical protein CDAR_472911 [Caerostris darwini]